MDAEDRGLAANAEFPKLQTSLSDLKVLTEEELAKLQKDTNIISEFKANKLEAEARKNWDIFYKRNTTKFFKDRHWTTREFEDLTGKKACGSGLTLLEVGCGVGNFMFPLMLEAPDIYFYACDFSPRAVQFVKDNPECRPNRSQVFVCDLTADQLSDNVPKGTVDVATMIFVLSAIHPDKMEAALRNIKTVLAPGGCVLLRDYGLYDHAMLRFAPGHKIGENFYMRQDGTRAYYFTKEKLCSLFEKAGFLPNKAEYILRETVNKKEGLCATRIFVQAKFIKSDININTSTINVEKCSLEDNDTAVLSDNKTEVMFSEYQDGNGSADTKTDSDIHSRSIVDNMASCQNPT